MFSFRHVILTALFIVFSFGGRPVVSKKCSTIDIYNCKFNNANTNGCYFHDKISECIRQLLSTCDDVDRLTANQQLSLNDKEKNECPSLPDGQCFVNEMITCRRDISPNLYDQGKCAALQRYGKTTKQCLEQIKDNCPFTFGMQVANEAISEISTLEKECEA